MWWGVVCGAVWTHQHGICNHARRVKTRWCGACGVVQVRLAACELQPQQIKTAQNDDLRSRRALFTPQSCKLLAFEGQSFLSVASSQTMKGCLVSRADGLQ